MNTDFRVATDMPDHPKTIHLVSRAGDHGFACLIRLWAWAAEHRPDGRLVGMSDALVEAKVGWSGPSGGFVAAILELPSCGGYEHGFAERSKTGELVLHDWKTHNSYAAAAPLRSLAAKTAADKRWTQLRRSQGLNAERMIGASQGAHAVGMRPASEAHDAPSPDPVPDPDPVPSPVPSPKKKTTPPTPPLGGSPPPAPVGVSPDPRPPGPKAADPWTEWFDSFWRLYPRKVAKTAARKAWMQLRPKRGDPFPLGTAIADLLETRTREWKGRPPDKIPYPATWLRSEEFTPEEKPHERSVRGETEGAAPSVDANQASQDDEVEPVGGVVSAEVHRTDVHGALGARRRDPDTDRGAARTPDPVNDDELDLLLGAGGEP